MKANGCRCRFLEPARQLLPEVTLADLRLLGSVSARSCMGHLNRCGFHDPAGPSHPARPRGRIESPGLTAC